MVGGVLRAKLKMFDDICHCYIGSFGTYLVKWGPYHLLVVSRIGLGHGWRDYHAYWQSTHCTLILTTIYFEQWYVQTGMFKRGIWLVQQSCCLNNHSWMPLQWLWVVNSWLMTVWGVGQRYNSRCKHIVKKTIKKYYWWIDWSILFVIKT